MRAPSLTKILMANKRQQRLRTFSGLAKAVDWYDVSLQAILEDLNLQSVNRTQSMILVHIASGVTRPSEIAKEMGTTRQNIHAMAKYLIEKQIIAQIPDPEDGRSKIYTFAEDGLILRNTVLQILTYLDQKLSDRLGPDTLKALNRALSSDWGDYIKTAPRRLKK